MMDDGSWFMIQKVDHGWWWWQIDGWSNGYPAIYDQPQWLVVLHLPLILQIWFLRWPPTSNCRISNTMKKGSYSATGHLELMGRNTTKCRIRGPVRNIYNVTVASTNKYQEYTTAECQFQESQVNLQTKMKVCVHAHRHLMIPKYRKNYT